MTINYGNDLTPTRENTSAIITIFHPGSGIVHHIERIIPQVNRIIVINNGCSHQTKTTIQSCLSGSPLHNIISNPFNKGLGYALNQGIMLTTSTHIKWALLLDQDTRVELNIIAELANTISSMPQIPAILGSNFRDPHTKKVYYCCNANTATYRTKDTVITSGTLLNLDYSRIIGAFNAEYFIDSIDHEYCLRAKTCGFLVYMNGQPLMTHTIGARKNTLINRLQCLLSYPHPPERKYYIARNSIATAITYANTFPCWSMRQFLKIFAELIAAIFFENSKRKRIIYT